MSCQFEHLPRLVDGEGVEDRAALARHAVGVHQENQLVGRQLDRGLGGYVLQAEVEDFASWRVADGRKQHDVVLVQPPAYGGGVDLADFPSVQQVLALDDADALGGDEVARGHPDVGARHRRIGEPQRQQGFDLDPYRAGGFLDAGQRCVVGDAQAAHIADCGAVLGQARLDLRPYAVYQNQPHAQTVQQVDVVRQLHEAPVRHQLSAKRNDEGLAAKTVNVRRGGAEPVNEMGSVFQ